MRFVRATTIVCWGILFPLVVHAAQREQPAANDESPPAAAEFPPRPNPAVPTPSTDADRFTDYEILIGPDGKPVRVRSDALLEKWLQSLDADSQPAGPVVPPFEVSSVALTGTAQDDNVALTATIQVQINRKDEFVLVPLALKEATLTGVEYKGEGQAIFDGHSRETGYRWWLKGSGSHELVLKMLLPIQRLVGTRRIQLTTPKSALSSLKLDVAHHEVRVVPLDGAIAVARKIDDQRSQIDVWGFGERIDLRWLPLPAPTRDEAVLQADTAIRAQISAQSVVIDAVQKISAVQGSFEEVTVQMPEGFRVSSVTGPEYSSHRDDPNRRNHVIVQFTEKTSGPVTLNWTLASETPANEVTLAGFNVLGAKQQAGEILVEVAEGLAVSSRQADAVLRKNVGNARSGERVVTAYRFLRQPFQLVLDVNEIEPSFSVQPEMLVRLSSDRAELRAQLKFDVFANLGVVREVELYWPGFDAEGWTFDASEVPPLVDRGTGIIRFRLARPMSGQFELSIQASRPIISDAEPFELTLPTARATRSLPATVSILQTENIESHIEPLSGTEILATATSELPLPQLPDEWNKLSRVNFQIPSSNPQFAVILTKHDRSVSVAANTVIDVQPDRLAITQELSYDVQYGRLSEVRVRVPESIAGQNVTFELGSGTASNLAGNVALTPLQLTSTGAMREFRLPLSEPLIGRFNIVARFATSLQSNSVDVRDVAVPLIQPAEGELTSVRVRFVGVERLEAAIGDDSWKRELAADGVDEWMYSGSRRQIPLRLLAPADAIGQTFTVSNAVIRTDIDANGVASAWAYYRFENTPPFVDITIPRQTAIDSIWLDGVDLKTTSAKRLESIEGGFRVRLEGVPAADAHLLSVQYHSRNSDPWSWTGTQDCVAPELQPDVWVKETVWQVAVPLEQHLFDVPQGFVPLFRWQRNTVFWSRVSTVTDPALRNMLTTTSDPPGWKTNPDANVYRFRRFGPAETLAFRFMSLPAIVLCGAGLAWVAGVVLLRVPATRHVLTALTMLLALTIVSLWFSEPVKLLLQPGLLGFTLAVIAVYIDDQLKRRRKTTLMSLSSASDFIASPTISSVDRPATISLPSAEGSSIRGRHIAPAEPISSESGSRL